MSASPVDPYPTRQATEFFKWVGICIKEWARIEAQIYEVCRLVLKAERTHVAIIYYRTPTIDARLTLADELVATTPGNAGISAEWKQLLKDIRALLPTRNLLAHSPVVMVHQTEWVDGEEPGAIEAVETSWFEVATSLEERLRGREVRVVKDDELPDHFQKVRSASLKLAKFVKRKLPPAKAI